MSELIDEDDADVAIYDLRKADLAAGHDDVLPVEVSQALLRGDSRLKAIRKWRGLTQSQLCRRIGMGQGYLSELESGRKRGGSDTLAVLAAALEVPAAWLT
jgi:DNA-binding transcriptional regulator YiaG